MQSILPNRKFENEILKKMVILSKTKIFIQPQITEYLDHIPEDQLLYLSMLIINRKKPVDRTNYDIDIIMFALKTFPFFEILNQVEGNLSESEYIEYCRFLELERISEGQFVFQKGEKGDKFYIIFTGRVEILIPKYVMEIQEDGTEQHVIQLEKVNEIGYKAHFGELALINDAPRIASIRCSENCVFGILKRISFNRIIAQAKINDLNRKTSFFKTIQLFSKFQNRTIQYLLYHFQLESYKMNQVIYREDDFASKIYIVNEGTVYNQYIFILIKFKMAKDIEVKRQGDQDSLVMAESVLKIKRVIKTVEFTTLGQGEIFGELDCMSNSRRHFTVISQSQGSQAYVISMEDFQRRVLDQNQNKEVKTFITKYLQEKIQFRNQRMLEITKTLEKKEDFIFGNYPLRGTYSQKEKTFNRNHSSSQQTPMPVPNKHQSLDIRQKTEDNSNIRIRFEQAVHNQPLLKSNSHFTSKPIDMFDYQLNKQMCHMGQFNLIKDRFKNRHQEKIQIYDQINIPDHMKRRYFNQLMGIKRKVSTKSEDQQSIDPIKRQNSRTINKSIGAIVHRNGSLLSNIEENKTKKNLSFTK